MYYVNVNIYDSGMKRLGIERIKRNDLATAKELILSVVYAFCYAKGVENNATVYVEYDITKDKSLYVGYEEATKFRFDREHGKFYDENELVAFHVTGRKEKHERFKQKRTAQP